MPQVRQSSRRDDKTGEAHHSFLLSNQLKAIETIIFGPRYACGGTWGTRPVPYGILIARTDSPPLNLRLTAAPLQLSRNEHSSRDSPAPVRLRHCC